MENFEKVLKRKQDYYGKTEGSYHMAAEEYATIKMIEENQSILEMAKIHTDSRAIMVLESRIDELKKMINYV
jgi:cell fate (sporulation/competence/biofilm development) regulator YlbF (YheA/YmcA/DUF963 family)